MLDTSISVDEEAEPIEIELPALNVISSRAILMTEFLVTSKKESLSLSGSPMSESVTTLKKLKNLMSLYHQQVKKLLYQNKRRGFPFHLTH